MRCRYDRHRSPDSTLQRWENMTIASLFAGIGGFDLGFELAGHETVLQCEVDKACREVLAYHWPEVRRHDDVRTLDGRDLRGVGIICGGFPCQDLSVAGKRGGLSESRSGLFFEMVRVVGEARPDYLVWENVPGLLSADGGRAMRTVIGELANIGYFGAWRVLDSQFFGVAQRRRRVFGVFAPGDSGWRRAGAILFDEPGGGWNPAKGRKAGKDIAHSLDSGTGGVSGKENQRTMVSPALIGVGPGRTGTTQDAYVEAVASSLRASDGHHGRSSPRGDGGDNIVPIGFNSRASQPSASIGAIQTLKGTTPLGTTCPPPDPDGMREAPGLPRGMDSRRYRQLGNAVTVNVAYWLGKRIANVEEHRRAK